MIDLAYFGEREPEAARIMAALTTTLGSITGRDCRVLLLPYLDDPRRARIMELNDIVFGGKRDVFDLRALQEVEADPDAIMMVGEIDGVLEACGFGYYEDPPGQLVEGADFFLDSGMVSPAWQGRGIGEVGGVALLLLLSLIRDVHDVGIAVWSDGEVDELVRLYRRFGFVDVPGHCPPHRCMRISLDAARIATLAGVLGVAPPAALSSR
jgi:GNAT superfamily N-acetyltransferase